MPYLPGIKILPVEPRHNSIIPGTLTSVYHRISLSLYLSTLRSVRGDKHGISKNFECVKRLILQDNRIWCLKFPL